MITKILILLLLSFSVNAFTSNDLVVELKAPTSCLELKAKYSKEPLVFNCEDSSAEKLRFASASFVGKKNTRLYVQELQKKPGISSVTFDQKVKKIE
jgi:hypothetical protein